MNEKAMKMMLASMVNRHLQSIDNVKQAQAMRDNFADMYEGVLWSIDERIKELEETDNED